MTISYKACNFCRASTVDQRPCCVQGQSCILDKCVGASLADRDEHTDIGTNRQTDGERHRKKKIKKQTERRQRCEMISTHRVERTARANHSIEIQITGSNETSDYGLSSHCVRDPLN